MIPSDQLPVLLARQIGCFPSVERVILFGSRARGDADATSDIDLAVECPGADYAEWSMIRSMREPPYTFDHVDIVRFDKASAPLQEEIRRDGKTLYEKQ